VHGIRDDVGRGVAAAHHQHPPVAQLLGGLVGARVDDLAVEGAGIDRHARGIVVAAGNHHAAVDAGLTFADDGHGPRAVALRRDRSHGFTEFDMVEQPEGPGKIPEIAEDADVARILRVVLVQHRQVVVAGGADGGDEVGALVDHPAWRGDVPQPADVLLAFQAVEGDAALDKILRHREPGGPGADDAIAEIATGALHDRREALSVFPLELQPCRQGCGAAPPKKGLDPSPRPSCLATQVEARGLSPVAAIFRRLERSRLSG
jgi:hypothetical protein